MLQARLKKNLARLSPGFKRAQTNAWRVYDRDIPERPWTIDLYGDAVLAQEFETPVARRQSDEARDAERREVEDAVRTTLGVTRIHWRTRARHRSIEREAKGSVANEFEVREHGARLLVNLTDYLDTGLFLDHRGARTRVAKAAKGRTVLNLFCYTGAFSVRAALGGALETTSVDLSPVYAGWAERNLALNGLSASAHRVVRSDVFAFLRDSRAFYDLIVLDPPTVSRASGGRSFEIQRAQTELVTLCLKRLSAQGTLLFSTNDRRFELDPALARTLDVRDVSDAIRPPDFRQSITRAFEIRPSG